MPCNSDYMESTCFEEELSRVYWLQDELAGRKHREDYGRGYDSRAYGKGQDQDKTDGLVASLCGQLKKIEADGKLADHSLEMQMWWRNHKKVDEEREIAEARASQNKEARAAALAKLTPEERKVLGLRS